MASLSADPIPANNFQSLSSNHQVNNNDGESIRQTVGQQFRLDIPLEDATRIARLRFGRNVGRCFGEFSCSHNRIPGRLYATNMAMLYYSNVLGFERRFYLEYQDIVEMGLVQTTSICFETAEGETYIFKSFENRKKVLRLLKSLEMMAATISAASSIMDPLQSTTATAPHYDSQIDDSLFDAETSPRAMMRMIVPRNQQQRRSMAEFDTDSIPSATSPPTRSFSYISLGRPTMGNRRRSVSDSVMNSSGDQLLTTPPPPPRSLTHARSDGFPSVPPLTPIRLLDEPEEPTSPPTPLRWDQVKARRPLTESALESLVLPCSLDEFFQNFLADDAPFSLMKYQSEHVKDRNVEATVWKSNSSNSDNSNENGSSSITTMTRTISFSHPIKKSMGLGPSEARTTREQRLSRYNDNLGILIENVTCIEGIPAADCFTIEDRWLLEPGDSTTMAQKTSGDRTDVATVKLSSSFEVRFTKRSIFRGIIEKNIKKETGDWWSGYRVMLQETLEQRSGNESLLAEEPKLAIREDQVLLIQASLQSMIRLLTLLVIILLVILTVVSIQLVTIHQDMSSMRNELLALVHQCGILPSVDFSRIAKEDRFVSHGVLSSDGIPH